MDKLIDIILHTDDTLMMLAANNVFIVYVILFLFIMLETGIILFPFLPGDGLLFSAGVVAASTDLDIRILVILLLIAAFSGNMMNYFMGAFFGLKMRTSENYYVKTYLMKYIPRAEAFYGRYGKSAVIIGRFFPIMRTYVPFIAGVVNMDKRTFVINTIIGGGIWIMLFLLTGFFVGEIDWVKNNYGIIFLILIMSTLIPILIAVVKKRMKR